MARQAARSGDSKRVTAELFTLTYGALVASIVKDFETDAEINDQLDKIGFNVGLRIVEDYLARGNSGRCSDFKETSAAVAKGFKTFLGITPTVAKFNASEDEFSLIMDNNPLTEFVDLPAEHPNLLYSNILAGAIRGALHNVQLEVEARFVQDQLRGDQTNEIRVKFIRRIQEVLAGMTSVQNFTHSTTPILQAWLIKGLRLAHSKKPGDRQKLHKLYEEACENEAQVCRITINDALKEPRDNSGFDSGERENTVPVHSNPPRIRPVQLIGESPLASQTTVTSTNNLESTSVMSTNSVVSGRLNNRGKVAFFDIFGSSSTLASTTSQTATVLSSSLTNVETTVVTNSSTATGVLTKTIPAYYSGCESSIENIGVNDCAKSNSLDSVSLPGTVSLRSDIPPNTVIDLTCTEPTDSLSVLSAAASALDTKCSSTNSVSPDSITMPNKSEDVPFTADPKILASLVADLACSVCGKLTTQPQMEPDGKTMNANILIECIQCGALYHQLCHQPPILSAKPVVQCEWRCGNCVNTTETSTSSASSKLVKSVADLSQSNSSVPSATKKPRQTGVELLINVPSIGARKRKPGFVHPQLDINRKLS